MFRIPPRFDQINWVRKNPIIIIKIHFSLSILDLSPSSTSFKWDISFKSSTFEYVTAKPSEHREAWKDYHRKWWCFLTSRESWNCYLMRKLISYRLDGCFEILNLINNFMTYYQMSTADTNWKACWNWTLNKIHTNKIINHLQMYDNNVLWVVR